MVLRGKVKAIKYRPVLKRSEINNLTSHVKKLEKEEQDKSKVRKRKEKMTRTEINKIDNRKIGKNKESKSWFFRDSNKTT